MSSANEMEDAVQPSNEETIVPLTANGKRRVRFPSDESQLRMISIAPEPLANQPLLSLGVILQRYRAACQRLQIRPLTCLLDQLVAMDDDRRSYDDRLESLNITNEKLDVKQMDAIEEILSRCRFHQLNLDSSICDDSTLSQFFDVIEYYESCTHLNLSNHRSMGAQGYQALARYLRRTRYLERLDMNCVRFDETMMFSFCRALRLASTLAELHLESCQLNGKTLQKFIQNLRSCPSIRELYLCDNRLQVQDSLLINDLIRTCGQFLHLLDLRSNALQDNGMSHIASQLSQYDEHHAQQNRISKISFQSNQLTQQGVAFLAKCLIHNRTIRSLNLSYNNLTNEGFFLLRDALLTNRTITELLLRNCRLTDQAAIALAEFIAESSTIRYIDLRENNIQASGICGIAIAIKTNQSLLKLDVDPVVPLLSNSSSPSANSIDRSTSNNSLLSLSNLRRMTVGIGSATSPASSNANSAVNTPELIEQKTKWMNDIAEICRRNSLIYEEQLRQQEEELQQSLGQPSVDVSETNMTNGTTQEESIMTSPNDIIQEETAVNGDASDEDGPMTTTANINGLFSIEDDSDSVPDPPEEIAKSVEPSMDVHHELEPVASDTNDQVAQPLENTASPAHHLESLNETTAMEHDAAEQQPNTDPIPLLSDANERDALEATETPDILPVQLNDATPDDENEDEEETEEMKKRLRHSDSLHLFRKKSDNDTDNTSDDESSISASLE